MSADHLHGDVHADGKGRGGDVHDVGDVCGRHELHEFGKRAGEQLHDHQPDGDGTVTVTNVNPATENYGSGAATTVTAQLSWTGGGTAPTGGLTFGNNLSGSYGAASCAGTSTPITCMAMFTPTATDTLGTYTLSASLRRQLATTGQRAARRPTTSASAKQTYGDTVTSVNQPRETYGSLTPTVVMATLRWTGGGTAPTGGLSFGTNAPRIGRASAGQPTAGRAARAAST